MNKLKTITFEDVLDGLVRLTICHLISSAVVLPMMMGLSTIAIGLGAVGVASLAIMDFS